MVGSGVFYISDEETEVQKERELCGLSLLSAPYMPNPGLSTLIQKMPSRKKIHHDPLTLNSEEETPFLIGYHEHILRVVLTHNAC